MKTRLALLSLVLFTLFPLSAQVVPILGTDVVSASRTTINNNFSYLNSHVLNVAGVSNTAAEQVFITSGIGAGAWLTFPPCPDGSGMHLNYDTSNPARWVCGTSGIYSLNGLLGGVQTFTNDTNVTIVSSGAAHVITWSGFLGLARGGGNANFSATGGPHQVVRQSTVGAAFSVSQLASADLSDAPNILFNNANFVFGAWTSDFSGAAHSVPWAVGTLAALPLTCNVGEAYFAANAAAGQQIYECDSLNHWTQQLNTGVIASLNGLTAAAQTFTNDTNVTIVSGAGAHVITWSGFLGLARGGGNANFAGTGGPHQVVRQSSVGANFSVSQLASTDLSDVANILFGNANLLFGAFISDFSGAAHSTPWKVGTIGAMPLTCTPGESYFATNATVGQMVYECSALNTWTEESGGIASLNGLTAATQTFTNDTNVTIVSGAGAHVITWSGFLSLARGGGNANFSATGGPHQVVRQSTVGAAFSVSQLASADLSDAANILFGNVNLTYGAFTSSFANAAHSTPWKVGTLAQLAGLTCAIGEGYFATNATAGQNIFECTSLNTWTQQLNSGGIASLNGLTGPTQTFVNDTNFSVVSLGTTHTLTWLAQLGLARGGCNADLSGTGGVHQVLRQSGLGANCTVSQLGSSDLSDVGNILFSNTNFVFGPNTADFSGAAHATPWKVGTFSQLPITCAIGEGFFVTNTTAGQNIYECTTANQWTQQLNSGAAGNVNIQVGGVLKGTRPYLNFANGFGINWVCADNPGATPARVDCTPTITTSDLNTLYAQISAPNTFGPASAPNIFSPSASKPGFGITAGTIPTAPMAGMFAINPGGLFGMFDGTNWHSFTSMLGTPTAFAANAVANHTAVWNGNGGNDILDSGLISKPGVISKTVQTGAIANGTLLCQGSTTSAETSPNCNTAGHYRVTAYLYSTVVCATPSTASIGLNLTWTDKVGTKSNQTIPLAVDGGMTMLATMPLGTTTDYATASTSLWSNGTAQINYGITYAGCVSGTGTYDAVISVEQIQ